MISNHCYTNMINCLYYQENLIHLIESYVINIDIIMKDHYVWKTNFLIKNISTNKKQNFMEKRMFWKNKY